MSMRWFEPEMKMINDDAFGVCKSHAMLHGIERKRKEANLKQILDKYFEDKERNEKDKKLVGQLNRLL